MSVGGLLTRVVQRLDRASIPYMIVGSMASTYHGEPRTTQDVDIVIDPVRESLIAFLRDLPADDYNVDIDVALDAFSRRGQFNLIDMDSGWKLDFILRRSRPFSVEEFRRRQPVDLVGIPVTIATAEDTIISKLEWAKASESERQLRDVRAVVAVMGDRLDRAYIDRWTQALALTEPWARIQAEE